jgi:uncharacterized protein YuzE
MNRSDSNNSLARAELKVEYVLGLNHRGNCLVAHNPSSSEQLSVDQKKKCEAFPIPARIDGNQTIAHWLYFELDNAIVDGKPIDRQVLVLTDSHGNTVDTEIVNIREQINETSKT